jgi:hypothetical protein
MHKSGVSEESTMALYLRLWISLRMVVSIIKSENEASDATY